MITDNRFDAAIARACEMAVISIEDMKSKGRSQELVSLRQTIAAAIKFNGYTLHEAGYPLNTDHANIYAGLRSWHNKMETSYQFRELYEPIYNECLRLIPIKRKTDDMIQDLVYLCGRVTGIEYDEIQSSFSRAVLVLESYGYVNVYTPIGREDADPREVNKVSLKKLLEAKLLVRLPDAIDCSWAIQEINIARNIGLKIREFAQFIKE